MVLTPNIQPFGGLTTLASPSDVGLVGLGPMGRGLAHNLSKSGRGVVLYSRTLGKVTAACSSGTSGTAFGVARTLGELAQRLHAPRTVIILVPAGRPAEAVIAGLAKVLDSDDVIIDAGNSHYLDTLRRCAAVEKVGIHLVDVGMACGEYGALHGASYSVGGAPSVVDRVRGLLEDTAVVVDGRPSVVQVGSSAAGHFIKMVYNGVEYAELQLISEAFGLLRDVRGCDHRSIASIFASWNRGEFHSELIDRSIEILEHVDPSTGRPFLDVVRDEAEQKGTGRWTVQNALELGVPAAGIAEATFARYASNMADQRCQMASSVETRGIPPTQPCLHSEASLEDIWRSLMASRAVAYAQGIDQVKAASAAYGWDVDLPSVALAWRGGMLSGQLLKRVQDAVSCDSRSAPLLSASYFADLLTASDEGWRRVVADSVREAVPIPALVGTLTHVDTLRKVQLPTALIQALRDSFGGHGYRRVDRSGRFHTMWDEDRAEVVMAASGDGTDGQI